MVKLRTKSQRLLGAFLAGVVMCSLLLQTSTFVFHQFGRVAVAAGVENSVSTAGDICGEQQDGAQQDGDLKSPAAPVRHGHCPHCILCSSGGQNSTLNAVALLASVFILISPQMEGAPAWLRHEAPALRPAGFASSWLARAPPRS